MPALRHLWVSYSEELTSLYTNLLKVAKLPDPQELKLHQRGACRVSG